MPSYAGQSVLRDAETEEFLRTIGTPIWQAAGLNPDDVTIILINDPEVNAYVAGGQNIFIHSGLLMKTENVDELLGVIAHESGHIAGGHVFIIKNRAETMARETLLATLLGTAAALATGQGNAAMGATAGVQQTSQRLMLQFSRTYESAADQAGIRFMQLAGFPTTGMASFLKKLSENELLPESRQVGYAMTHPLSRDRMQAVLAQTKPGGSLPAEWGARFTRIQAKLRGFLDPSFVLKNPDNRFAGRYGQAQAWLARGDAPNALKLLAGLLKEAPQDPYIYELQGQAALKNGNLADAVTAFATANQLKTHIPLLLQQWGEALVQADQPQKALKPLLEARDLDARDGGTYRILARAYGALGNVPLANAATAEAASLIGDKKLAKQKAKLAIRDLPAGDSTRRRMDDLLASLDNMKSGGDAADDKTSP